MSTPEPEAGVKRAAEGDAAPAAKRAKTDGGDERAALLDCVDGACRKSVDAGVCGTALAMFDAYAEVLGMLRSRLAVSQVKQACKLLEELWICAMQDPAAAVLDNPFQQLLLSDKCDAIEAAWEKQFARSVPWDDVLQVYQAAASRTDATIRLAAADGGAVVATPDDVFNASAFEVLDLTGEEVLRRGRVVWNEYNDTNDPNRRAAIVKKFSGKVLHWSIRGATLLTRPLIPSADPQLLALAATAPLPLAVHSLVYGSMFVTGQAMGLSPRFHEQIHTHAWARPALPCLTIEMFAHMVNRRSAPHPFLSMIPAADGADSIGRAQDFDLMKYVEKLGARRVGVVMCNPPYVEAVMDRDLPRVLAALDAAAAREVSLTVALLLPDWLDNKGVGLVVASPHLRSHWHLKKKRHMACLENGSEVVMGVGQRLCLLSTDADAAFDDGLWAAIAVDPAKTPVVPPDCKVL
eukprot:TRINITY_DN25741_c0_g1_i1.p1 TRINITY_DN25741_c0_g1~~TRINITY_DN25741_c0_g1_i1.p1  ORF type:complete len:481 (+),score=206.37 TRINITY_DN25741_c0_g1_i1:53-1444(+)